MNKYIFFALSLVLLFTVACTTNTNLDAVDCTTVTGATFTTNSGKMSAAIQSQCSGSQCHSAGGKEANAFLASTDYNTIKSYLSKGATSVLNGSMPEGSKLTTAQLELWQCWKESGFAQ